MIAFTTARSDLTDETCRRWPTCNDVVAIDYRGRISEVDSRSFDRLSDTNRL